MDESIGNRIARLIKTLGIKRVQFAERIQVDQSYVTQLTKGRNTPSDRLISIICREFNVNETWLRTGEGEMFNKKEPEPLDALLSELLGGEKVTTEDRILIKNFLELSDASRKAVIEFVQKCAKELATPVPLPAPDADLGARLAELERQLAAEKARADAAEADAKAKAEELLALYREDEATGDRRGLSVEALERRPSSR